MSAARHRTRWFVLGALAIALVLAGLVSNVASNDPDGLDAATLEGCTVDAGGTITGGTCIAQAERDHELGDSPLADYGIRGIGNGFLANGLAGVLGVLLTFAAGAALVWLVRRRRPPSPAESSPAESSPAESSPAESSPAESSRAESSRG